MLELVGSGSWALANGAWRSQWRQGLNDFVDACGLRVDGQDAGASSFRNGSPGTSQHVAGGE